MSLLAQLKKDSMLARKAADSVRATLLSTLIGEAEMVGKNAGNRESTDDEVQQTIRKFLKNNQEALGVIKDAERRVALEQESAILTAYLPPMAGEAEVKAFWRADSMVCGPALSARSSTRRLPARSTTAAETA